MLIDTSRLLGRHILPKLATAYDVVEFADLLWTAQALAHSDSDDRNILSSRDDLGDGVSPKDSRLLGFFTDGLCVYAPEIIRHGLPNVGPRARARLAEALALAERLGEAVSDIRRDQRERKQANATPLQRQAWEERAKAWLWRDCWDYNNREHMESMEGIRPEGKPEVAA